MSDEILARMRALIGDRFDYLGTRWTLVEVLADEGQLVLRRGRPGAIQVDQYGQANRRADETLLVPVFSAGDELAPELSDLLKRKVRD